MGASFERGVKAWSSRVSLLSIYDVGTVARGVYRVWVDTLGNKSKANDGDGVDETPPSPTITLSRGSN